VPPDRSDADGETVPAVASAVGSASPTAVHPASASTASTPTANGAGLLMVRCLHRAYRGVMSDAQTPDRVTMFGADWCRDCRRSKALLDRLGVDYDYVDVEADERAAARAEAISGRKNIPVVVLPDGTHFVEPSDAELESALQAV
jgi:mycoredoxin